LGKRVFVPRNEGGTNILAPICGASMVSFGDGGYIWGEKEGFVLLKRMVRNARGKKNHGKTLSLPVRRIILEHLCEYVKRCASARFLRTGKEKFKPGKPKRNS
jgi:hypothetical protein